MRNKFLLAISLGVLLTIALTVWVLIRPDKEPITRVDTVGISKSDQFFSGQEVFGDSADDYFPQSSTLPQSSGEVSGSLQPSASVGKTLNSQPSAQKSIPTSPLVQNLSVIEKLTYVKAVAAVSAELDLINNSTSIQAQLQNPSAQVYQDLKLKADRVRLNIQQVPVPLGQEKIAARYNLVYSEFSSFVNILIEATTLSSMEEVQKKIDSSELIFSNFIDDLTSLSTDIRS